MIDYLKTNGLIGEELAKLYTETDIQLGIAFAIDRGVWHWDSAKRRLWRVREVLEELAITGRVQLTDPDNRLGFAAAGYAERDPYFEAVQALAKSLSAGPRCNCGVQRGLRADHESQCAAAYMKR